MRTAKLLTLIFFAVGPVFFFGGSILAQETADDNDKTLSPYFFVKNREESKTEQLPLKSTSAEVAIAGVIADVKITQLYANQGHNPIEAIYVFPGSTRAAVYAMKMTIGERVRIAKIREKTAARREYQKAKAAGKSASLLEQQRPNVFRMSVANIMPGDQIKVELSYTELLLPENGCYEFVYPAVVGPRYSNTKINSSKAAGEQWIANPYLHQGKAPTYDFDINVRLAAGSPIKDIASSSHQVQVSYQAASQALIKLAPGGEFSGNRDYILRYRLQGSQIESGILLHQGQTENFFLLMMHPPRRPAASEIPPREYIFVVDVSGSMSGFPLQISQKLLRSLLGGLTDRDKFNILLFAGASAFLSEEMLPATDSNISKAINIINEQYGAGATELLPALQRALSFPKNERTSRSIVVVTDGYISVETEVFELIRSSLHTANLFAFGIGSSVNRHLIEGMARAGHGEPFVVTKEREAAYLAAKFQKYIQTPLLTGITVDYQNFRAYEIEPRTLPDMLAERPAVIFGKWDGEPQGRITLHGYQGNREYSQTIDLAKMNLSLDNPALRYLWARHKIKQLSDYKDLSGDQTLIDQITSLGLKYNLLTAYTSFIAVDQIVRNAQGQPAAVKQPLPLPQGVSDAAVGGEIATVPEPQTYFLIMLVGLVLIWQTRKIRRNSAAIDIWNTTNDIS